MAHGVSGKLLEERLGRNGGCEGTGRGISLVSLWGDVEGMFFFFFFSFFLEGWGWGDVLVQKWNGMMMFDV